MYLAAWMTQEFGVSWVRREDGRGWEIKGITPEMVTTFSSRRETVVPLVEQWIAEYPGKHEGRKPTQRQIKEKREEITRQTRDAKEAPPDFEKLRPEWSAQFYRKTGVRLADVAPLVSRAGPGRAGAHADADADAGRLTQLAPHLRRQVALMALSAVQAGRNAWTRYELMDQLARNMDPRAANLGPAATVQLLHDMTEEILAGKYQPVTSLDADEIVAVPAELRRADGKSVYQRHAGATYATTAQLTIEQQLLADAGMEREPLIERELAAQLLGSDAATLETQAQQRPDAGSDARTRTGLRFDQAAAMHAALTDPKTFTLLTGPPGSGKTFALVAAAKAAKQAGVPEVYGITCSQAARNVLAEECARAGVKISAWNSTQFLDRISRPAGDPYRLVVAPGSLFLLDEASMTSMGHFGQLARVVVRSGGKGIGGGDQAQLPAVEGGGGYAMLAREQGYVQVGEPGRFASMWERDASLRLRAGDETVLDVYDQHARIHGGTPEEMLEQASQTAVAYIAGEQDVLLMAASREDCRELSRRVRDELVRLGLVDSGSTVLLAEGARASVDDLIILRQNDHPAGLANGDVVRIETIEDDGTVRIRKATGRDPETGAPAFGKVMRYGSLEEFDSAYATTAHSAEGRSVTVGFPYITGSESRQWLTVAMTRGGQENIAFVACNSPKAADPKAGVRAAPELARKERLDAERAGEDVPAGEEQPGTADPLAVLATILQRDGTQLSATETRKRNEANADHLALLAPMWDDAITALRTGRYRQVLDEVVPGSYRPGIEDSPKATWLWRSLRQAEAAGLDAGEVLADAVGSGDLAGSRGVAAVLYKRVGKQLDGHVPLPAGTWASEVPEGAPAWVRNLATLQDGREVRLGQHAAVTQPEWAVNAFGPVPDDPEDRAKWEGQAGPVFAYRERYRYEHPSDAIGPEPSANSPEQRARWHRAFAALGPVDGPDLRHEETGKLLLIRDQYKYETEWAPRFVAPALRQERIKVAEAGQFIMRSEAEQRAAEKRGDLETAGKLAQSGEWWAKLQQSYREHEAELAKIDQAYQDWDHTVKDALQRAEAADVILHQREPGLVLEPLRSAEPPAVAEEERAQLDAGPGQEAERPSWLDGAVRSAEKAAEAIANRRSMREPGEDPETDPDREPAWLAPDPVQRDAIIHPPEPWMPPAPQIEPDLEAGG